MKTLFYFTAPWCAPCTSFSPIMDQVSKKIPVDKINIDYATDRAKSANVQSIPTVVLAENGQEIKRFTGPKSYEQVMDWLNS